jgi:hypothetical protein
MQFLTLALLATTAAATIPMKDSFLLKSSGSNQTKFNDLYVGLAQLRGNYNAAVLQDRKDSEPFALGTNHSLVVMQKDMHQNFEMMLVMNHYHTCKEILSSYYDHILGSEYFKLTLCLPT